MADGVEAAVAGGRHQAQPVDDQRVLDAGEQALGQPIEVEIGVQLAGEADQRAAVVVAVAVEHPLDRALHAVLHRAGEQQHHHGGERGDHPPVVVLRGHEVDAGGADDHRVDRHDGADRGGVDQQPLQDALDVHQPVAHDRRREGQRHDAERHRGEFHRQRRHRAERERNGVGEDERPGADRRAPHDPAQLPQRRRRPHALQRQREDRQAGDHVGGDVERLEPVEPGDRADHPRRILGRPHQHDGAQRADGDRRHVEQRPAAMRQAGERARAGALGEDQAEVHEQRRQEQRGDLVGPVEDPVDAIEPAREREGEHAEERHGEPEEMQRGLVVGAAGAHRGADQQREDADRRQHVVEAADTARNRRQRHLRDTAIAEREQRVGVARAAAGRLLQRVHVVAGSRWPGRRPPAARRRAGRRRAPPAMPGSTSAATTPVVRCTHSTPSSTSSRVAPLNDVGQSEQQQRGRDADRQRRAHAPAPFGGGGLTGGGGQRRTSEANRG